MKAERSVEGKRQSFWVISTERRNGSRLGKVDWNRVVGNLEMNSISRLISSVTFRETLAWISTLLFMKSDVVVRKRWDDIRFAQKDAVWRNCSFSSAAFNSADTLLCHLIFLNVKWLMRCFSSLFSRVTSRKLGWNFWTCSVWKTVVDLWNKAKEYLNAFVWTAPTVLK